MEVGEVVEEGLEVVSDGETERVPGDCSPEVEVGLPEGLLLLVTPEATPHALAVNGTSSAPAIALAALLPLTASQMF